MMSSGPSLILSHKADYQPTMKFLMNIAVGSIFTISNFSVKTGIDYLECVKVLEELTQGGFLEKLLAIRCPECGLLLETFYPEDYTIGTRYCASCDMDSDISADCIEVVFRVVNNPFSVGQKNKIMISEHSSAHKNFSLETFLENGGSFNREFYCPTEDEYKLLAEKYENIFKAHKTTKECGDSLESLVLNLFRCCRHFSATEKIKLGDNQIDCFVRNKMYIPGISQFGTVDFFVIECKNEKDPPGITYFNKLHSILINNSLQFGVIVSKCRAANTLNKFARTIFLKDNIIIINLDSDDLKKIIIDRENLLECMERKMGEVKLGVAGDLKEMGLFGV